MNVSVVVPTLDEEDQLPGLMDCLSGQLTPSDEFIVVDGGSEDKTTRLAQLVLKEEMDCSGMVMVADGEGIGASRAIGAKAAENEIVVSTDADARPPSGWVNHIKKRFEMDDELLLLWGVVTDTNGKPIRNLIGKYTTPFGGTSGGNTAFRRSAYEKSGVEYFDIDFAEDGEFIRAMGKQGKVVHDRDMVVPMNMDRGRYQTVPLVSAGALTVLLSNKIPERFRREAKWCGVGLIGTELFYEAGTDSPLHHDEAGAILAALGSVSEGESAERLRGLGVGVVFHHVATEGISAIESKLAEKTSEVIGGDGDA